MKEIIRILLLVIAMILAGRVDEPVTVEPAVLDSPIPLPTDLPPTITVVPPSVPTETPEPFTAVISSAVPVDGPVIPDPTVLITPDPTKGP